MDEEYMNENDGETLDTALYLEQTEEVSEDTPLPQNEQNEEIETKVSENVEDEKSISSDLIRGHINTIILRALYDGDKYGYEIITEIERKSRGQYSMKQPSLYSALKRLEKDGFVTSYWGGSVGGGRRKYFSLTDNGKEMAERNQSEWEYSRTVIDNLISDREFDFENNKLPSAVDMRVLRQSTSRVSARIDEDEVSSDEEIDFTPQTFEDDEPQMEEAVQEQPVDEILVTTEKANVEEEIVAPTSQEEPTTESRLEQLSFDDLLQPQTQSTEEPQEVEEDVFATSLAAEKAQQNAKIAEERTTEENEILARIEEEQRKRFQEAQAEAQRQREQEEIHQNYLNLVNQTHQEQPSEQPYFEPNGQLQEPQQPVQPFYPEADRNYRSVIQKLYANAVNSTPAPQEPTPIEPSAPINKWEEELKPQERPSSITPPSPSEINKDVGATFLGKIDFYDLEARAAQDGIRIATAGGSRKERVETPTNSLVHKGKALFFSSILVFILCIIEGGIALGLHNSLDLPLFYPFFIWGTGLALVLITGLAYVNHYGERALRQTGNLIINTIISYALCLILIFIIALAAQADFSDGGQVASFIIFPIVYFFGIVVFGVSYYFQICPKQEKLKF